MGHTNTIYLKSVFFFSSQLCQFYVYDKGSCYLANVQTNKSAIASRSDSQTIYIYQGKMIKRFGKDKLVWIIFCLAI
jgi:hypothetical protein